MNKKIQSFNQLSAEFKELSDDELLDFTGGVALPATGAGSTKSSSSSLSRTAYIASIAVSGVDMGYYTSSAYSEMMVYYPY